MAGELEKLAYEAALRGLDKQEGLLEELRGRTGILLAASSLAASFLGQQAFRFPSPKGFAIAALAAFVASIASSVFILLPKRNLVFAPAGGDVYSSFYAVRKDLSEVYRRLAYDLDRFWESNDKEIGHMSKAFTIAAGLLVVETLSLVAIFGGSIL
ncbi:MAG TPA: hypothetical protein VK480_10115 [Solirubrobacterales bacterium]|nr:hypothetical protein [Solirubrobacterales bacterium]